MFSVSKLLERSPERKNFEDRFCVLLHSREGSIKACVRKGSCASVNETSKTHRASSLSLDCSSVPNVEGSCIARNSHYNDGFQKRNLLDRSNRKCFELNLIARYYMVTLVNNSTLDFSSRMQALMAWVVDTDTRVPLIIQPAEFPDTGRGMIALKDIQINDMIIELPLSKLVTRSKATHEFDLPLMSEHQAMTAWMMGHKMRVDMNLRSEFTPYIDCVPLYFSSAANFPAEIQALLPDEIILLCDKIEGRIANDWVAVGPLADKLTPRNALPQIHLDLPILFRWAWFAVNSRCISLNTNIRKTSTTVSADDDTIALAPYLDLLNHDQKTTISPFYDPCRKIFQIVSQSPFKKGDQVFINYGGHDDAFLAIEYGFVSIERNVFNYVCFQADISKLLLDSEKVPLVIAKVLEECGLNDAKGCVIDWDGPGYRTLMILRLLFCKDNHLQDIPKWWRVWSGHTEVVSVKNETRVLGWIAKISRCKLDVFVKKLKGLETLEVGRIFLESSKSAAADDHYPVIIARKLLTDSIQILQPLCRK